MELTQLKDLRKLRKMKIKDLAALTGIHRNDISRIEHGDANPSWQRLQAIAKALNCEIIIYPKPL